MLPVYSGYNFQNFSEIFTSIDSIHFFTKNFLFLVFFFFSVFSRAAPVAYGGSQTRGLIGAVAAGLCHSHSNARSGLHLRPTPELMAMPDP